MKVTKIIKYIMLMTILLTFNVNVVKAENCKIECKYEMYPTGYRDSFSLYTGEETYTAKFNYCNYDTNKNKNKYKMNFEQSITNLKDNNVKESSFNKEVKANGCPMYIYATKTNAKKIDFDDFQKKMNKIILITDLETFESKYEKYKYPMVLVEQNGKKVTSGLNQTLSHIMNKWSAIIEEEQSAFEKSKCDKRLIDSTKRTQVQNISDDCKTAADKYNRAVLAASKLKSSIENSPAALTVAKTIPSWQNFSNFVLFSEAGSEYSDLVKKEEDLQETLDNSSQDYCSLYCAETHCKGTKNTPAYASCVSGCNVTLKPKCDEAYNSCKSIMMASAQNDCIRGALTSKGLDSSYTVDKANKMNEMQNDLEQTRKKINVITSKASALKITIGKGYKVQCSDVSMLHDLWIVVIILAPGLTLGFTTFDLFKAVMSSDVEKMNKSWKNFPKRILALLFLILVPILVSAIVNISTDKTSSDKNLMYCIINGGE